MRHLRIRVINRGWALQSTRNYTILRNVNLSADNLTLW